MTGRNKAIWFAVAGIAFSGTVALAQTNYGQSTGGGGGGGGGVTAGPGGYGGGTGYGGGSYLIPRDRAPNVADEPEEPSAWLGASLQQFKSAYLANEGAPISKGAIVTNVEPGGPAASANIQRGDVILAVDDVPLQPDKEAMSVASAVKSRGIGATSKLTILREDRQIKIAVKLGQRPRTRSSDPEVEARVRSDCPETRLYPGSAGYEGDKQETVICGAAVRQAAASDNNEFFTKLNELFGSCTANILAPKSRELIYKIKPAIDLTNADLASIYRLVKMCPDRKKTSFGSNSDADYWFKNRNVSVTYLTDRGNATKQFVEARLMFEESKIKGQKRALEATPTFVLGNAYISYIILKRCEQAREGYAAVYISDAEMERARTAVKRLEEKLTRGGQLISPADGETWTTNSMWEKASQIVERQPVPYGDELRHALPTKIPPAYGCLSDAGARG